MNKYAATPCNIKMKLTSANGVKVEKVMKVNNIYLHNQFGNILINSVKGAYTFFTTNSGNGVSTFLKTKRVLEGINI